MAKAKTKILITDFEGFNVHNPEQAGKGLRKNWIEFETLAQAEAFAEVVKDYGWEESKELLKRFQAVLGAPKAETDSALGISG